MDMIERMARAIIQEMNQAPVSDEEWQRAKNQPGEMGAVNGWCRAVLRAMREPTPAMVSAGCAVMCDPEDPDARAWQIVEYQAMIDAATKETP